MSKIVKNNLKIKILLFVFFAVAATSAVGWLTYYVVSHFL